MKLRACPFCGSGDLAFEVAPPPTHACYIECRGCGARGPKLPAGEAEEVDWKWNAGDLHAEIRRLRDLLESQKAAHSGLRSAVASFLGSYEYHEGEMQRMLRWASEKAKELEP